MLFSEPKIPQSGAGGGFLVPTQFGFSALQRAENSSIVSEEPQTIRIARVSVLFSEPKIPQYYIEDYVAQLRFAVSVLFSEPKIPQYTPARRAVHRSRGFSALQRAENSSIEALSA